MTRKWQIWVHFGVVFNTPFIGHEFYSQSGNEAHENSAKLIPKIHCQTKGGGGGRIIVSPRYATAPLVVYSNVDRLFFGLFSLCNFFNSSLALWISAHCTAHQLSRWPTHPLRAFSSLHWSWAVGLSAWKFITPTAYTFRTRQLSLHADLLTTQHRQHGTVFLQTF